MAGLRKDKKINLSDSNIAGLGSEVEKEVRLNAARTEAAWKDVGKGVGLLVWRIEKFHIVAVPEKSIGHFFDGDSYICLKTYKKQDDPKLYHDVHFWLGTETTQDEAGTAAYKTVELDDYLMAANNQHRECQGFESKLFLSYFPHFIIAHGGIESGFHHVGPKEYKSRLFHIYGNKAKHLSVTQRELTYKSLNDNDVFVLDKGLQIYQFNGVKSTGQERHKAAEFSHALASDRAGAHVTVFEQDDNDATPFWEGIGGKGPISSLEVEEAAAAPHVRKLFQISDSTGELVTKEVASGKAVNKSFLVGDDVFLLDAGAEIFVWVGKGATDQEKKSGLQIAVNYITKNNLPPATPVSRILEGGENAEFYSFLA